MPAKKTTNPDMPSIKYRHNFLSEVVARIDFLSPIDELKSKLPSKISKQAKKYFPIPEPREVVGREYQVSPTELHAKEIASKEWVFHDKDRKCNFNIGTHAALVQYTAYTSYEEMKTKYMDILGTCFDSFPDLQGGRLGLRYINKIRTDGSDPLSWSDYINPQMLGVLAFAPDPNYVSRIFHVLEYNFGDFNLRYQFGLPNPDFPATIKQRLFIIDLDAYRQEVLDLSEISRHLDQFHVKIQTLFEQSITDGLRGVMNEQ